MGLIKNVSVPGNIDQAQYCERIKGIIELLGSKLSLDELSKIWRIQVSTEITYMFFYYRLSVAVRSVCLGCNSVFKLITLLFELGKRRWTCTSSSFSTNT